MKYFEGRVGNFNIRVNANEGGIHADLRKISKNGGEREPGLLHILKSEVTNGMTCIDLGANIGYVTLLLADIVGPHGKIFAIEPDPNNVELLKNNIKINKFEERTKIFQMGISNIKGVSDFYIGLSSNLGGMIKRHNTNSDPIKIKIDTLSNFCKEYDIPDLIKMDIEGYEVEVLEGMFDIIKERSDPCKIVMELHPVYYSKEHSLEYWMNKFINYGFHTKYIVSAGVPIPDMFKEWKYSPIKVFSSGRGLYNNFSDEHMLISCCHTNKQLISPKRGFSPKIARFVLIERT